MAGSANLFSRPLHGLRLGSRLIPAINRWAILSRPLNADSQDVTFWARPLLLGEGRGEGLATKPKILLSPFYLSGQEKGWGRVFFSCTQLDPHPNLFQRGK